MSYKARRSLIKNLWTGSGWNGMTAAGRVGKELGESEVAEGGMGWVLGYLPLSLSSILFLLPAFSSPHTRLESLFTGYNQGKAWVIPRLQFGFGSYCLRDQLPTGKFYFFLPDDQWRRGGVIISALDFGWSHPGWGPGARFSKVPKSFRTRKAVAKSQTL